MALSSKNDSLLGIEELVHRCLAYDREAQRELFDRYSPKLMGVCRRYVRNAFQADDVFQEVFINVFNNLHQWKPEKGAFESWSYRIAVNTSLAFLKQESRLETTDLEDIPDLEADDFEELDEEVSFEFLLEIIDKLPVKQKTVFNLYVIDGFTHKEIAQMMGINEGTSKSQLAKARVNIRKLFQDTKKFEY